MSGLAEFLEARIAEEERAAKAAILPIYGQTGEWLTFDDKEHLSPSVVFASNGGDRLGQACDTALSWIGIPARDHIARWDPSRVLAECEARRRIVEEHGGRAPFHADPCDAHDASGHTIPCDTLRFLAAPFSDHPDYDPSWRV